MHIALCVKQELDATGPFNLTEEIVSIDKSGLINIINPADLAALALIREAFPTGVAKVTAISVGPKSVESALRACVASGADEAIRIWDSSLSEETNGSEIIARVLAAAISSLKVDLIVCGSQGLCGASGFVGPALAEYLDFAQICSVSHLEITQEKNELIAHRRLDRGDREIVASKLPAVITVDEGAAEIPYPSFPKVLDSERIEIPLMDLALVGLNYASVKASSVGRLLNYVPPRPRTKRSAAPDTSNLSPMQMMQQLTGGGPAKAKSSFVEGEPKKAAAEIVRFLEANGILS